MEKNGLDVFRSQILSGFVRAPHVIDFPLDCKMFACPVSSIKC